VEDVPRRWSPAAVAAPLGSYSHLLRLQSFVVGSDNLRGFRAELTSAYTRWFGDGDRGYPGHTLLVVPALANPALSVEIEGWFTTPPRDESPQGA
jgi:2-iminobutanoate/2-iminopropanoate deaminase